MATVDKTEKKKKKAKARVHVEYDHKELLVPKSIRTMAAIHTKIKSDGTAIIRISDCNRCIRLFNNMNSKEEVNEMLDKIDNMTRVLFKMREQVLAKDPTNMRL
jgi:hypothetical protein